MAPSPTLRLGWTSGASFSSFTSTAEEGSASRATLRRPRFGDVSRCHDPSSHLAVRASFPDEHVRVQRIFRLSLTGLCASGSVLSKPCGTMSVDWHSGEKWVLTLTFPKSSNTESKSSLDTLGTPSGRSAVRWRRLPLAGCGRSAGPGRAAVRGRRGGASARASSATVHWGGKQAWRVHSTPS